MITASIRDFSRLICVRIPRSHRRRAKIEALLGFKPQSYWTFKSHSQFVFLTEGDFAKVHPLGATRSRLRDVSRCWPSSDPRFAPNQPYPTP